MFFGPDALDALKTFLIFSALKKILEAKPAIQLYCQLKHFTKINMNNIQQIWNGELEFPFYKINPLKFQNM